MNEEADSRQADIQHIIELLEHHGKEYMNEIALMRELNETGCVCNKSVRLVEIQGIEMPIKSWTYHNGKVVACSDGYRLTEEVKK